MLLAGDIGGTKTNLAVYSPKAGLRRPLAEATFPTANYSSLEELVEEFLTQINFPIDRASFGVAGPVVAGRATITNLTWVMDGNPYSLISLPLERPFRCLDISGGGPSGGASLVLPS